MTHTPGPWKITPWSRENKELCVHSGKVWIGNVVLGGKVDLETRDANARLIAAAPDLLEALDLYVGYWEEIQDPDEDDQRMLEAGLAAIQKARGV